VQHERILERLAPQEDHRLAAAEARPISMCVPIDAGGPGTATTTSDIDLVEVEPREVRRLKETPLSGMCWDSAGHASRQRPTGAVLLGICWWTYRDAIRT
jgi:hypothetical protein